MPATDGRGACTRSEPAAGAAVVPCCVTVACASSAGKGAICTPGAGAAAAGDSAAGCSRAAKHWANQSCKPPPTTGISVCSCFLSAACAPVEGEVAACSVAAGEVAACSVAAGEGAACSAAAGEVALCSLATDEVENCTSGGGGAVAGDSAEGCSRAAERSATQSCKPLADKSHCTNNPQLICDGAGVRRPRHASSFWRSRCCCSYVRSGADFLLLCKAPAPAT